MILFGDDTDEEGLASSHIDSYYKHSSSVNSSGISDALVTVDHSVVIRKYTSTKPNIPFKVYRSDFLQTDANFEESKIKKFFSVYFPEKTESNADDFDSLEEEEEDERKKKAAEDEIACKSDGSTSVERVDLSWPYWTYMSRHLGINGFSAPLFMMKQYYIDMIFRIPYGKSSFNGKYQCFLRINQDTISEQTQGKVLFTADPYNILPLSIEVIREHSNLPGIWDKVLVTKGKSPFIPGALCALSDDIASVAHNPIFRGDSFGESMANPVVYELHSSYTTNPDIVRLINVDFEKLKSEVEPHINTRSNKKLEIRKNTSLQNNLEFIVLSYINEIIECIKDLNARLWKNIFNKEKEAICIPFVAISEWINKKQQLVDREKKLMDIKDIQLVIQPSSRHDLSMVTDMVKSGKFDTTQAEYICQIRMHYLPLRMSMASNTGSGKNGIMGFSSSSSSSSSNGGNNITTGNGDVNEINVQIHSSSGDMSNMGSLSSPNSASSRSHVMMNAGINNNLEWLYSSKK